MLQDRMGYGMLLRLPRVSLGLCTNQPQQPPLGLPHGRAPPATLPPVPKQGDSAWVVNPISQISTVKPTAITSPFPNANPNVSFSPLIPPTARLFDGQFSPSTSAVPREVSSSLCLKAPCDRSHIPDYARPAYEVVSREIERLRSSVLPAQKRQVDDLECRNNPLFDALNCETLSRSVVDQLLVLTGALETLDRPAALAIHVDLLTRGSQMGNIALWISGVKELFMRLWLFNGPSGVESDRLWTVGTLNSFYQNATKQNEIV
ncbi:hypothetical protein GYMLUDRAFT_63945 [Collybiopsis luxurians FD-317 M1]|uniref:SRA1/Sec31 domain-containing protein n=1 Tax=Collybiopsis luxurians FD-317 M1 TaxID=944289 RepID=A0A0D0BEE0_9AGAR|nr:hypothetical protein GYMLUDRAFT_63945 [Collybiopsis luxurians FD-317 M1]